MHLNTDSTAQQAEMCVKVCRAPDSSFINAQNPRKLNSKMLNYESSILPSFNHSDILLFIFETLMTMFLLHSDD